MKASRSEKKSMALIALVYSFAAFSGWIGLDFYMDSEFELFKVKAGIVYSITLGITCYVAFRVTHAKQ